MRLLLLLTLPALASAALAAPGDEDPILKALNERLAARPAGGLPAGSTARLRLDVLDVAPGIGMRTLGKFSAPLEPQHPALLSRRVDLPPRRGLEPLSLRIEIEIRSIVLGEARARFDIESVVRLEASAQSPFARHTSEELAAGRSALMEAFQVPGTSRRLMVALTWEVVAANPLQEIARERRQAAPARMVDLQIELVRRHQDKEEILKQQRISTGLGTEALTLLKLVGRPLGRNEVQQMEVRLTPRSVSPDGLLLAVEVRGALQGEEDAPGIWIDHRDEARIGSGHRYSLEIEGDGPDAAGWRLDIRPYYEPGG